MSNRMILAVAVIPLASLLAAGLMVCGRPADVSVCDRCCE